MAVAGALSSLVVAACDDGSVRIWGLHDGAVRRAPLKADDGPVTALAAGLVNGASVLVSSTFSGPVRAWWLASGAPMGPPLPGEDPVAVSAVGGRFVVISSDVRGRMCVRDPVTARVLRLGEPLDDSHGDVQALTVGHSDGRQVVVCGGIDEPVLRVWDLDRRTLDRVQPSPAHVLALARLPARIGRAT